jgi:hypothetical protein
MKKPVLLAVFSTTLISIVTHAEMAPLVIYGEDGRQEVYEASEFNQKLAASTATMIAKSKMTRSADKVGVVQLDQSSLKSWLESQLKTPDTSKVCEDEPFINQPNPGMCSGFLIAPDLLITAGHCVTSYDFCSAYSWVFDYQLDKNSKQAGFDIKEENIFHCKKVVSSNLDNLLGLDYAMIQLDRQVVGRAPLEIRSEKIIVPNTELTVIGSPSGLPLKVTVGGTLRDNTHPYWFSANLDTYQGNSGSAVFNAQTGVVEGILVRGENDFVPNTAMSCIQSNKCDEGKCRGEDVSRMTSIPEIAVQKVLAEAAANGDVETLTAISKNNIWVDVYGKDRKSALIKASARAQAGSIKILLASGADVNLSDVGGNTSLHHLAIMLNDENVEALDLLLGAKADINLKNNAGHSPLMVAVNASNAAGARLLIKAGADVPDVNGETAIFAILRSGSINGLKTLIKAGASVEVVNSKGESLLDLAKSLRLKKARTIIKRARKKELKLLANKNKA